MTDDDINTLFSVLRTVREKLWIDPEVVARVKEAMQISKEHLDKCVAARGFVHTDMSCTLRLSDVKAMLEALSAMEVKS